MTQLALIFPGDEEDSVGQFNDVRHVWKDNQWHFSVIDVIAVLTQSSNPRRYWTDLKRRMQAEGSEVYAEIVHLKMEAPDGKRRTTDAATEEQILRIIQSVPSPRAEPFKRWLARVGAERLEEERDPELGIQRSVDRAAARYERLGRPSGWINDRLQGTISRRAFTDALKAAVEEGLADGELFARATSSVYKGVFHRTAADLRRDLNLDSRQNPRDHMQRVALGFLSIAEALCADELGDAQNITPEQARHIVSEVAHMVGVSADVLQERVGRDLVTGRPLLPSGY